jgi:hypothetical protein
VEPLIAVSDAARARIRAKEAKADEKYWSVRRALEGDVVRANLTWGGYFDLHEDNLQEALREAKEGFDETDRLCAQLVYVAHASEYRTLAPQPKALEPVLASLREAVIKQYGEQTRTAVQSVEAQQMAIAWNDQSVPEAPEAATSARVNVGSEAGDFVRPSGQPLRGIAQGGTIELPKLSEASQRKLDLEWEDLIEARGFDGAHLKWHDSPARRHKAARPPFSLAPPPTVDHGRTTHYWEGQPIPYDEWLKNQEDAWAARQNNPEVVDLIGIAETTALSTTRFQRVVSEYRSLWAASIDPRTKSFAVWLEALKALVISECRTLWTGEWHSNWFTRACESKIAADLSALARQEASRTRKLEIMHPENPHLSLVAIVAADGNLDSALTFEQTEKALRLGRETLQLLEQVRFVEGTIPDVPELSKAVKRTLAIQWDALVDQYRLTAQDIDRYASANDRIRQIAVAKPPDIRSGRWLESWLLEHQRATQESGITPSVSVAKASFTNLASQYWLLWESSGAEYKTFSDQLDVLKRQVLADVALIWKGRSDAAARWYETACARAIETELSTLIKERVRQARNVELSRLLCAPGTRVTTGNPILDEIYAGGDNLSPAALRALELAGVRREQVVPPAATVHSVEPETAAAGASLMTQPTEAAITMNGSDVPDLPDAVERPEQNVELGSLPIEDAHVDLLEAILNRGPTTLEKWAKEHKLGRTTVFDWKALRIAGKSLSGKVSTEKSAEIEEAIDRDAKALGLGTRTNSD